MNKKKIIICDSTQRIRKSTKHMNEELFDSKKQISMINQLYLDEDFNGKKDVEKALKKKLLSYKAQDQRQQRYSEADFITLEELKEKLVLSKLRCHYSFQTLVIMYNQIREEKQWTTLTEPQISV